MADPAAGDHRHDDLRVKPGAIRSAVDLVLILIGVSLLISPVPPTVMRREIAPPAGAPAAPTVVSLQDRNTVDGDHAGESTELAPGRAAETVAPPGHDPVPTRQSKTPAAMRGASSAAASYSVRIGPISESNAVEIIRRIAAVHYSVRTADGQTEPQRFRVISAPVPRNEAQHLASTVVHEGAVRIIEGGPYSAAAFLVSFRSNGCGRIDVCSTWELCVVGR